MKSRIEMKHENSKKTITVAASQVGNAKYYGWTEVVKSDDPAKLKTSKGNNYVKSTRK